MINNNKEQEIHRPSRKAVKVKAAIMNLTELKEKIPLRDYAWAREQMGNGLSVRRKEWMPGKFIWFNKARSKPVYPERGDVFSIAPIDLDFLLKHRIKRFTIGGHTNMWHPDTCSIQVGYSLRQGDKNAGDWELYSE